MKIDFYIYIHGSVQFLPKQEMKCSLAYGPLVDFMDLMASERSLVELKIG